MISVKGLRKTFGSIVAVDDVGFTAEGKMVTGLLGPNGAGKTTTLRMLYTLIDPDSGTAMIDGKDVAREPAAVRRLIGVLPDSRGLYPRLTTREHIRYFGHLHGLLGKELERRIDELVELLDIEDLIERRVEGFSQGERVKVALARAMVHDPPNVILDEPTNGLDVMSTRALREVIRRLEAQGRCVLFSSHVMQEVAALCGRIVVIDKGRVVADGTPEELLAQTGQDSLEDAFVAATGAVGGDAS